MKSLHVLAICLILSMPASASAGRSFKALKEWCTKLLDGFTAIPEMHYLPNGLRSISKGFQVRFIDPKNPKADYLFMRTDRGQQALKDYYPGYLVEFATMRGWRVLDAGTGDGRFVYEMREKGVEADGLDIFLNKDQKDAGFFIEADMRKIPVSDETYDATYANMTVFSYYNQYSTEFRMDAMKELIRVTKTGGVIRVSPVLGLHIKAFLKRFPELHLTHSQKVPDKELQDVDARYVEFKKRDLRR